ncbi:unnamed protein product, partial [Hymenolepis diminuta]
EETPETTGSSTSKTDLLPAESPKEYSVIKINSTMLNVTWNFKTLSQNGVKTLTIALTPISSKPRMRNAKISQRSKTIRLPSSSTEYNLVVQEIGGSNRSLNLGRFGAKSEETPETTGSSTSKTG